MNLKILNFFKHGLTNAKAENLNGKIQFIFRF
jgi:transposase